MTGTVVFQALALGLYKVSCTLSHRILTTRVTPTHIGSLASPQDHTAMRGLSSNSHPSEAWPLGIGHESYHDL